MENAWPFSTLQEPCIKQSRGTKVNKEIMNGVAHSALRYLYLSRFLLGKKIREKIYFKQQIIDFFPPAEKHYLNNKLQV